MIGPYRGNPGGRENRARSQVICTLCHLEKKPEDRAKNKEAFIAHMEVPKRKTANSLVTHWTGFVLSFNRLDIPEGNNAAERALRIRVMGRKNVIGAGALRSANLAAWICSLFETRRKNRIDIRTVLTDDVTVSAILGGKAPDDISPVLPQTTSADRPFSSFQPSMNSSRQRTIPPAPSVCANVRNPSQDPISIMLPKIDQCAASKPDFSKTAAQRGDRFMSTSLMS